MKYAGVWTFAITGFIGAAILWGLVGIIKVLGMVYNAVGDSPVSMGLVAIGVIALLALVIKIKKR